MPFSPLRTNLVASYTANRKWSSVRSTQVHCSRYLDTAPHFVALDGLRQQRKHLRSQLLARQRVSNRVEREETRCMLQAPFA